MNENNENEGDGKDDKVVSTNVKGKKPKKKSTVPVRKRYKHVKRHVNKPKTVNPVDEPEPDVLNCDISDEVPSSPNLILEHDYAKPGSPSPSVSRPSSSLSRPGSSLSCTLSISLPDLSEDNSMTETSSVFSPTSSESWYSPSPQPPSTPKKDPEAVFRAPLPPDVTSNLLIVVRNKLLLMLPNHFTPVVDSRGIHVLMLGRRESKAVQRDIFVTSKGDVRIEVHGQQYDSSSVLKDVMLPKPLLTEEDSGYFVDRIVQIVNNVRSLEICAGFDNHEFKDAWDFSSKGVGVVDCDVYKECRYRETYRSKKCALLLPTKYWRCKECSKMQPVLKRRLEGLQKEEPHGFTNTRYLSDKQKDKRLESKAKKIKIQSSTIDKLRKKMQELLVKDGVKVDKELSSDLTEILQSTNLSVSQSLFLQQQLKAANCKKSCGMRWHPTLIRLALSIYLKSPSAYRTLTESGFIKLPTSRTLFDYSHATKIEQGIDTTVLANIAKQVSEEEKSRKQYHVLLADEMHISKNLVVQKTTGEIIGFTNLDDLDKEVKLLDTYLDNPDTVVEDEVATKIMAFMVRGISSRVKDVVASYPVCNPSPKQMYIWTWNVIGALEKSGIRVITFTCDGASTNRAFIKLHKPVTVLDSGIIFDTVNKYAPNRVLYFMSDVPHLLKTIRNGLFNSRLGKKGTRCMRKNGQTLVWDTIIKLYLAKKNCTLRKSYKLNAQNVFPDSYSKMKVPLAAAVMSKTVASDIASQQWPGTSELVDFILKTNNWFDLLNGAYSSHGVRTNNRRLDPYTMADVTAFQNNDENSRFKELLDFCNYLNEWKEEILTKQKQGGNVSIMSELGVQPLDDVSFHALEESQSEENEFNSKCLLPHQTLLGIEMSTRAFIGAVSFLLGEDGISFVNARSFCQDPLEQNFGKQRQGGGGSCTPNTHQYFFKQRAISTIGQLAAAKRTAGNTEVVNEDNCISSEPLPKRRCKRGNK